MPSRWTQRRTRLRTLLTAGQCVHPGSVFDPISARIAEDLGFEVGMFAGSVASLTVLGAPDIIVLTLSEFADQAHRICRAGELPLLVDADHGYGNALNVMRTVEALENAGVAALSIEDTLLPKTFGETRASLIPIAEGIGKMQAALAARRDPDLVIAGRTNARAVADFNEVIERAQAYQAVGVDAIFVVGVKTRQELEALSGVLTVPIILGGAGAQLMDLEYLAGQGVRICLQSHQPFMAAVRAVYDTLKALREGRQPAEIDYVASEELMQQVTRDADYTAWTRDFMQPGK
jgi:carboxyvinyl-carboxyphosphonate phosphorylmutase